MTPEEIAAEAAAKAAGAQASGQKEGDSQAAGKKEPDLNKKIEPADEKKYSDADFDRMFNEKFGRKMAALEKQYGKLDDLKAKAAKADELEQAKLSDTERLNNKLSKIEKDNLDKDIQLSEFKVRDSKRSKLEAKIAAGEMALPSGLTLTEAVKMVGGIEDEEIDASIGLLVKAFPIQTTPPNKKAADGSGHPPVKGGTGSTKSFTRAEIDGMTSAEYETNREAIMEAIGKGLIT